MIGSVPVWPPEAGSLFGRSGLTGPRELFGALPWPLEPAPSSAASAPGLPPLLDTTPPQPTKALVIVTLIAADSAAFRTFASMVLLRGRVTSLLV
jgi:hypothetical protein